MSSIPLTVVPRRAHAGYVCSLRLLAPRPGEDAPGSACSGDDGDVLNATCMKDLFAAGIAVFYYSVYYYHGLCTLYAK